MDSPAFGVVESVGLCPSQQQTGDPAPAPGATDAGGHIRCRVCASRHFKPSELCVYDSDTVLSYAHTQGVGMAVLNIRVDDQVRDELKSIADGAGVSVSEYVRDLVMAAIVPGYEPTEDHGVQPVPESMRIADRQVLSLLHRILASVLPEDDDDIDKDDELARARVIESGFTGEYWREVAGFSAELSKRDCGRVLDILDMFRIITFSIRRLEKDGTTVDDDLRYELEFQGFDGNDGLEGHMASYVEFLMSDGKWPELQEQVDNNDAGNSHTLVLDTYMRMVTEHRRIKASRDRGHRLDDYLLSLDELAQIASARVHPSSRA
nr:YfbU family protein [Rhodococcus sp. (in: high G+C Gram-positive bacteria)]